MNSVFKRTGLLLSAIFLVGIALQIAKGFIVRDVGLLETLSHPYVFILFLMVFLSLLSAYKPKLAWIQPCLFLLGTAIGVLTGPESYYGLGFFVISMLLLFRLGFFEKRKAIKFSVALFYLFSLEVGSLLKQGQGVFQALVPVFYILSMLLMLYLAYEEKLMVYLKEPKPVVSLAARGLSPLEAGYVFALIAGKTSKEMAVEFDVTESTARNNISRCFHKLGMEDRHSFTIFTTQNEIVD